MLLCHVPAAKKCFLISRALDPNRLEAADGFWASIGSLNMNILDMDGSVLRSLLVFAVVRSMVVLFLCHFRILQFLQLRVHAMVPWYSCSIPGTITHRTGTSRLLCELLFFPRGRWVLYYWQA